MQKFRRRPLSVSAIQHTDPVPRIWYTSKGIVAAERGDWLIHEPSGLVWLCRADEFHRTFEEDPSCQS